MQNKKGTTLIEILVYSLILSFVLLIIGNLLYFLLTFWQRNKVSKSIYRNSNFLNQKLEKDMAEIYDITLPTDGEFVDQLTMVSTISGQINYYVNDNMLFRNGEQVTDGDVIISVSGTDLGFRLVDSSVDWRMQMESKHTVLTGKQPIRVIKGTIFIPNMK
jgi:competence protein ComGC